MKVPFDDGQGLESRVETGCLCKGPRQWGGRRGDNRPVANLDPCMLQVHIADGGMIAASFGDKAQVFDGVVCGHRFGEARDGFLDQCLTT